MAISALIVLGLVASSSSTAIEHVSTTAADQSYSPLAGLPALSKTHWSWPRAGCKWGEGGDGSGGLCSNDTEATIKDYARITHSLPLSLSRQDVREWDQSVRICHEVIEAGGNCSLGIRRPRSLIFGRVFLVRASSMCCCSCC
jgi:hypothetical protein